MAENVRLPGHEETIAAVTIFDAEGRVVRVVPATQFRPTPWSPRDRSTLAGERRARRRDLPGAPPRTTVGGAPEIDVPPVISR